ncbi:MAG: DNA polymerase IV [Lachnospiraceae bacterium]|nr:DNA polymerase IV [Lachnospiraceae bacterium]
MRTIFHIDVNSAFLSWSAVKQLKENPDAVDLRTIPSAVGGDVTTRHGIITAKSIPAKKYGVQTGEPVVKALQKCPELVLVRSDFATYRAYSAAFIDILRSYSEILEQVSIDEAYLDVTELIEDSDGLTAETLAGMIRKEIREKLGFTVNVGISVNKFLAKMASDFAKPDRTHTLYPEEIREKLWPLPIRDLHGCGASTAQKLMQIGILTIGDAAAMQKELLQSYLGQKAGEYIYERANGRSSDVVHAESEKAKSYSNETTMSEDITAENYDEKADPVLRGLAEHVSARMERGQARGLTVSVSAKTDDFRRRSRQTTLEKPTRDADVIYATAQMLLRELCFGESALLADGRGIRLIGVGVSKLDEGGYEQTDLFDWMKTQEEEKEKKQQAAERQQKTEQLDRMMENIQARFGKKSLQRGITERGTE